MMSMSTKHHSLDDTFDPIEAVSLFFFFSLLILNLTSQMLTSQIAIPKTENSQSSSTWRSMEANVSRTYRPEYSNFRNSLSWVLRRPTGGIFTTPQRFNDLH